ncbi:MAG: MarR family winged helix-turn-helix transcriptional regulator [Eubacterium sp.]
MNEKKYCPCCGRHCDLNTPHCDRGVEYARTGAAVEQGEHRNRLKNALHVANYNEMDIDNKLVMNLRDLGHMIRFLFEGKGSQKRIMIILNETGGMTQRELTERIGIQPGSVSEVIGKLESAGLIKRSPSETDRRTTNVRLTEAGQKEAEEAVRQRKTRHQEMFSCLSEEEKSTLLKLIEKLNHDWDSRYRENNRDFGNHGMGKKGHGPHAHGGYHGSFHRH